MSKHSTAYASLTGLGIVVMGLHQLVGLTGSAGSTTTATTSSAVSSATPTASSSTTASSTTSSSTSSATTSTSSATTTSAATSSATTATASATSTAAASGFKDGTYTGTTETYQFGTLSVTVTISGGKITAVTENLTEDGSGRTQQIDSYAVPELRQEVLSAQSSSISMISGATFTSQAYEASLQSALDQA